MTRRAFTEDLQQLQNQVLRLSSMVDKAIEDAAEALMNNNIPLAEQVIAGDADINRLRFDIEEMAYVILSTQQPLARDLRTVIAAIHFAIELERIGDHAAGIARIAMRMEGIPWQEAIGPVAALTDPAADEQLEDAAGDEERVLHLKLSRIPKMTKRARDMLRQAIEAHIERNVDKANAIVKRDRKLDSQYRKLFAEAMAELHVQQLAELPTYLLWIAHNLERIGDRITNLAERVIFMVTGQYTEVLEDYE